MDVKDQHIIKTTFQLKRGLAERWVAVNPILQPGEPGFELDTNKLKIGDGITPWNDLPYQGEVLFYTKQEMDDIISHIEESRVQGIRINGVELPLDEGMADLPMSGANVFGVSSVDDESLTSNDGRLSIKSVSTDLFVQGEKEIILSGGTASVNV